MKVTLSDIRRIIAEEIELSEQGEDFARYHMTDGHDKFAVYYNEKEEQLYVDMEGNRINIHISKYEDGVPAAGWFEYKGKQYEGKIEEPRSTYRPDTPGDFDDPEEWRESKTPELKGDRNAIDDVSVQQIIKEEIAAYLKEVESNCKNKIQ